MMNTIELDPAQLAALQRAAGESGAVLETSYLGDFLPASEQRCVALRCTSPGQLMRFAGLITIRQPGSVPSWLLSQLAARVCEDGAGNDARRVYYWPGMIAP